MNQTRNSYTKQLLKEAAVLYTAAVKLASMGVHSNAHTLIMLFGKFQLLVTCSYAFLFKQNFLSGETHEFNHCVIIV